MSANHITVFFFDGDFGCSGFKIGNKGNGFLHAVFNGFGKTSLFSSQRDQNQINQTDKEIDNMVYKLYDLTEDEIKIVERKIWKK